MTLVKSLIGELVDSEARALIDKLRAVVEFANVDAEFFPVPDKDITNYANNVFPYLRSRCAILLGGEHANQAIDYFGARKYSYTVAFSEPRLYLPNGYYIRVFTDAEVKDREFRHLVMSS